MAATQKGTTLKISFGDYAYTGYVPESISYSKPNGNIEILHDADGATLTKILMDPGVKFTGTFLILGASGSVIPPAQGDTVTLTPPQGTSTSFYCESGEVASAAGANRLTLDLIAETSMTYT